MTERFTSLLRKINQEYAGLCAEDILRIVNEGLNPDNPEERLEYKRRVKSKTLKPIEISISREAKEQMEKRLIEERLENISHTKASPQVPGKRSADNIGTVSGPQKTNAPRHYEGYGG